ncbi:MAG: hypothetical protein JW929_15655 [Anaerolineales bacterium]|nr:hypothetical protein [Anaerolineales bacterium]
MRAKKIGLAVCAVCLALSAMLTACGGGGDGTATPGSGEEHSLPSPQPGYPAEGGLPSPEPGYPQP